MSGGGTLPGSEPAATMRLQSEDHSRQMSSGLSKAESLMVYESISLAAYIVMTSRYTSESRNIDARP